MTLPTGSVTFLFTDIEGSTRLFQQHPDAMPVALARHHAIVQEAIAAHSGHVFQVVGDGFCAAFLAPADALAAALDAQRRLHAEPWAQTGPLRVRMGLHTGPAETRNDDYESGITLIRVQRIMAAGHGGQTLVSPVTAELIHPDLPPDVALRDLGAYRLRGLSQPEHVFQLVTPDLPADFPPLRVVQSAVGDQGPTTLLDQLVRGRMVGRGAELRQLEQHWARALQAQGHLVTLSGEPGIGKTRLAQELIHRARMAGAAVLRGGCYEYEATAPYLPFVEAMRDWAHRHSAASLQAHLGDTAPEIAKLAPEITSKLGPLPANPPLPPNEERLRLFDNVARFLQGIAAQRGLLVFTDDLHWADQGSLSLLHYLLRRLRHDRVLFLAAYREVELDRTHPLAAALVAWNRERLVTRLTLGRLSRAETGALLANLFGQESTWPEFTDVVYRETEGNPFFAEEVIKALIDQGQVYRADNHWQPQEIHDLALPQSVREAIGRRLSRLSQPCIDVLHTAAALGKQFSFRELVAVSTLDEDALLDGLDEASAAQLLAPRQEEAFAFTHDKIREVLVEELNPIRRRRLHRRIGQGLEQLYSTDLEQHAQDLAYHFCQAGDLEKCLTYSLQAATRASRLFAHDEALGFLSQAREAAEDLNRTQTQAEIDTSIGNIYHLRGLYLEATASLQRALEQTTLPAQRAALKATIGAVYTDVGDPRGLPFLHEALVELDPESQPDERAIALAHLARFHHYRTEHSLAIQYLEQARQLAEPGNQPLGLTLIYTYMAGAYQHMARLEDSDDWAGATVALGERLSHPIAMAFGHEFLSENASLQGYWQKTLDHAHRNREIGERIGAQSRVAWSELSRGVGLMNIGQLGAARAAAEAGLELSERIGETRLATLLNPLIAMIAAYQGDDEGVQRHSQQGRRRAQALGQLYMTVYGLNAEGVVHILQGQWQQAAAVYEQAMDLVGGSENRAAQLIPGAHAAEALARVGRLSEAQALIDQHLSLAVNAPAPYYEGIGQRVLAHILAIQGDYDGAARAFATALAIQERLNSRLEVALILLRRASMWQQQGQLDLAQDDAQQAQAIFADCGARPPAA